MVNEYLKTAPFDLYELHLFQLVARHGSFTKAAEVVGLTQSAVTRQIQGIERRIGADLFERTTRSVRLTRAGAMLVTESARIIGDVGQTLQKVREEFAGAKKEIRVGVSRSIGLAYLPGFFHANLRRAADVGYRVSYDASIQILSALEADQIDVGVVCPPRRMPSTLRVTHRFSDAFALIGSRQAGDGFPAKVAPAELKRWAERQPWLLLAENSNTGNNLRRWMVDQRLEIDPSMQLDSFDLIISLVALGMGVSFVPMRALALYSPKRSLRRLPWPVRFEREIVVVVRRNRKIPVHLEQFIKNVLF